MAKPQETDRNPSIKNYINMQIKPDIEETIALNASIDNLPQFREFIKMHCAKRGISEDILFDLTFVVDEACTNIIEHGYEGLMPGKIALTIGIYADHVMITLVDNGRAFEPDDAIEPDVNADWQDRKIGGLGWHLIKELTDKITYQSDSIQGNRLVLIKKMK